MRIKYMHRLISLLLILCLLGASPALAAEEDETPLIDGTPPRITTDLPARLNVPVGGSFTLSVTAEGEELSCQWFFNNEPIEGATGLSYTVSSASPTNAGAYHCYLTNGLGGTESASCALKVLETPELTTDIGITSLTLTEGDTISLSAAASGEELRCQWYYVLNSTDIRPIEGQTSPALSLQAKAEYNGAEFYCQFSNEAGAVITSFCRVTVNPAPTPSPEPDPPKETKPPYGETVSEGESAIFIARADNATEYVWRFVNKDGTSYDYTSINGLFPGLRVSGGNTETLTLNAIPRELNGWSVRCLFKGPGGETLSGSALIAVVATAATITITRQPTGGVMALDEKEDFTLSIQAASTGGGTLSYQWYSAPTNSSASMTPISGATESSYRPPRAEGTTYYRAAVYVNNNGVVSQPFYSYTVNVTFTAAKAHQHVYSDAWEHDGISHWHQCVCGDHSEEAMHSYEWTIIVRPTEEKDGQQKGICSVCGYETVQPIPAGSMPQEEEKAAPAAETPETKKSGGRGWLFALLGVGAAGVIAGAAYLILRILRQDDEWEYEDEYETDGEETYENEDEEDVDDTKQFPEDMTERK